MLLPCLVMGVDGQVHGWKSAIYTLLLFSFFLLSNCGRYSSLFIIAEAGVQTIIQITKDLLKVPNHRLKEREKENYRDNNRLFLQYFDVAGSYFRFLPHSVRLCGQ